MYACQLLTIFVENFSVLVTTEIDGITYKALMSKDLAELYKSPQCGKKSLLSK